LATYPLDLAHGRMAADMSKKPTIALDKAIKKNKTRLYTSVRECLTKTQNQSSRKLTNIYKGLPTALFSQVPYTVVLMSTFELLSQVSQSETTTFDGKKDDISFIYKYMIRFGPATLGLLLA
jgi:translation initiation factor 2B subunit (eIF-2B alpha/beta/delta family)